MPTGRKSHFYIFNGATAKPSLYTRKLPRTPLDRITRDLGQLQTNFDWRTFTKRPIYAQPTPMNQSGNKIQISKPNCIVPLIGNAPCWPKPNIDEVSMLGDLPPHVPHLNGSKITGSGLTLIQGARQIHQVLHFTYRNAVKRVTIKRLRKIPQSKTISVITQLTVKPNPGSSRLE